MMSTILGNGDGAKSASRRASAWCGYRVSSFDSRVCLVAEVSLDSLLKTPFGIAQKQLVVWQLPLFKYLSCWFGFKWTSNRKFPFELYDISMSSKGKEWHSMTEFFFVIFVVLFTPFSLGIQILVVNTNFSELSRSLTIIWNVFNHLVTSSVFQLPLKRIS